MLLLKITLHFPPQPAPLLIVVGFKGLMKCRTTIRQRAIFALHSISVKRYTQYSHAVHYFCAMKKLYYKFQEWRYHRLFKKLFWYYTTKKNNDAANAINEALLAFEWLFGFEYKDLYHHFRK